MDNQNARNEPQGLGPDLESDPEPDHVQVPARNITSFFSYINRYDQFESDMPFEYQTQLEYQLETAAIQAIPAYSSLPFQPAVISQAPYHAIVHVSNAELNYIMAGVDAAHNRFVEDADPEVRAWLE